jgi:hypothetical protein
MTYRGPITKASTAVFRDMAMLRDCILGGEPVNKGGQFWVRKGHGGSAPAGVREGVEGWQTS